MQRRTLILGLGSFLILGGVAVWLTARNGMLPGYSRLRTYTDDATGITDGTKVRLDGIPVGYLDHQRLTGARDRKRRVEFDLKVKSSFLLQIPVDSRVGVVADNLLGNKAININPGQSSQHVESGAELAPALAVDPNKMMADMGNTLEDFQKVVDRGNQVLSSVYAGNGSIGKLKNNSASWGRIPVEAQAFLKDYTTANGTLRKVLIDNGELHGDIDSTQKRLDDILAALKSGQGTAANLGNLAHELDETMKQMDQLQAAMHARTGDLTGLEQKMERLSARFDEISSRINSGQGTLGQLLVNPQLNDAIAGAATQFQAFARDLRANPRKFVAFRLGLF